MLETHAREMKVTVILVTYNHEQHIAAAIEGVLRQHVDFSFELFITEDCSTDATRAVLHAFRARYPDLIRLFLSPRNLNTNDVFTRALAAARGEYIATLDGDDFWTSPVKLSVQCRYLDEHPECVVCFHQAQVLHSDGRYDPQLYTSPQQPAVSTISDLWSGNFIASCSAMIRRSSLAVVPAWYRDVSFGDWPLYLIAAQSGSIGFIPEVMGTYRYHGAGLWNRLTRVQQLEATRDFLKSIAPHFGREHRAAIGAQIARVSCDLIDTHLQAGSSRAARAALIRAVVRDRLLRYAGRGSVMSWARKVVDRD